MKSDDKRQVRRSALMAIIERVEGEGPWREIEVELFQLLSPWEVRLDLQLEPPDWVFSGPTALTIDEDGKETFEFELGHLQANGSTEWGRVWSPVPTFFRSVDAAIEKFHHRYCFGSNLLIEEVSDEYLPRWTATIRASGEVTGIAESYELPVAIVLADLRYMMCGGYRDLRVEVTE